MSSLAHPNLDRLKRKRGGQPGNTNALRSGKRSKRVKAARMAERRVAWEAERRRADQWIKSQPGYKIDYAALCEAIERERQEQEAEEAQRVAHLKLALSL